MSTNYPTDFDVFTDKIPADNNGTLIPSEAFSVPAISPYEYEFQHHILSNSSVIIPTFISTSNNPPDLSKRFFIDYDNNKMVFNVADINTSTFATYLADGDEVKSSDFNNIQDAIEAIETILGKNPQGSYSTVKAFLDWLSDRFNSSIGHSHTGATNDGPLLTANAFSNFALSNANIANDADINPTKIAYFSPVEGVSDSSTLCDTLNFLYNHGVFDITPYGESALVGNISMRGYGGTSLIIDENEIGISTSNTIPWASVIKTSSDIADITTRSHTSLTSIGTNTHAQIDSVLISTSNHLSTIDGELTSTSGHISLIDDALISTSNHLSTIDEALISTSNALNTALLGSEPTPKDGLFWLDGTVLKVWNGSWVSINP
jgi:hypothetical protein